MIDLTPEQQAEQIHARYCGVPSLHHVSVGEKCCPLYQEIRDVLRQVERETWKEAANIATTGRFHFPTLAEEFRRRSMGG